MARVTGPSRDELDARGDEFAARVRRTIRATLTEVAETTRTENDLGRIRTVWRRTATETLAPHITRAWNTAVEGVRTQLEKINLDRQRALTAAPVFEIPKVSNPLAKSFLDGATNRLVGIGDLVWETARGELIKGLDLGEGVAEIRERVIESANLSTRRAEVVARTEINSAMNNGAYAQMQVLDVATIKEWIATNDSRTRESHAEVDGEEIDGDAKFMVGGFPMDHPHDLSAPPGETINCRCTLAWEIVDDDDEDDEDVDLEEDDDDDDDEDDDYYIVAAGDFDESKHPRDGKGRFAKKAGTGYKAAKKLKITHVLVHKKYEPGTVIAINGGDDKRVVWDGKQYRLQRKTDEGKWTTEKSVLKSKAYVEVNAYDSDWRTPEEDNAPANDAAESKSDTQPTTPPVTPAGNTLSPSSPSSPSAPVTPKSMSGYKKIGGQAGSQTGGLFLDPDGGKWYVKALKSDNHAKNEVLSNKLYELAGVKVPQVELVSLDNGPLVGETGVGVQSKIVDGNKNLVSSMKDPAFKKKMHEDFAVDAWLGNWDVVGLGYDNVIVDTDGNPVRVDAGGSLLYRAQGTPKGSAFGDEVTEIDTLRKYSINPQSANIFQDVSDDDIRKGVARIEAITPAQIDDLVDGMGFAPQTAKRLKNTLKARREDLVKRFGSKATSSGATTPETSTPAPAPTSMPAPTPASAPDPAVDASKSSSVAVTPQPMFDLTKVGGKLGSQAGAQFEDMNGDKWYVKTPPTSDHARSEFLAANLYNFLDVPVAQTSLVEIDSTKLPGHSGVGVKQQMVNSNKNGLDLVKDPALKKQLMESFAIDAWLGNWNLTGSNFDNITQDPKTGKMVRRNFNGALLYRAQGSEKGDAFGNEVTEIDTLRNPLSNPNSAKLFADVTDEDIRAGIAKIESLKPSTIDFLVDAAGFTGTKATKLKSTLKARREYLIKKYTASSAPATTTPAPSTPTPAPSTQPTQNNALGGTVKTYTSLQKAKVQSIFAKHDLKWYNKTPAIYDAALEVSKTYPDLTVGDALDIMDQSLKKKTGNPFRTKVEKWLKTNAGKAHVTAVGGSAPVGSTASKTPGAGPSTPTSSPAPLKPAVEFGTPLPRELTAKDADTLQERMDKAWPPPWNASQRAALKRYTGDSYVEINKCLRDNSGCTPGIMSTIAQIQKAVKPSTDTITVYRKTHKDAFGVYGGSVGMVEAFDKKMATMIGKTFEDKGVTSTSIKKDVFSGSVHLEIEVPKGAKIAWVKRVSQHSHEDEIILAPGTRFEIISVKNHDVVEHWRVMKVRVVVDEEYAA